MLFVACLSVAAVAVSAAPLENRAAAIALPLKKHVNVTSISNIVQKGHARISAINGEQAAPAARAVQVSSGTVTNEDVTYVAAVTIGGKSYDLIVDTGSSNTWCGAQSACEKSSTGKSTGGTVSVTYGSGSFSGTEYTDTVSFGGLTVSSQSIGSASTSSGFSGVDGIIGFGPVGLTSGTVSNANTVPTFLDNLKSQGSISTEVLGVSFKPESGSDTDDANGELTLGGTDSSKYTGTLTYFPKLTSGSAAAYWGISIASFTYGSQTLASSASGIVDTGTTLIYIPSSAYSAFLSATGGKTDSSSGLAVFTTKPTANFGIKFGSTTYTLTPAQYLVPTAQYSVFGLTSGKYYAWINNGGSSGVNTIIGQKFLENYYSVYDTTNSRIGFATAA
ncbi:hypothetical protein KVR01_002506 [Diaporthe batatas]|uniref:uncharacterized protein n=1 Tax=Diaporthe batatas TaxID=748121 RepID=UPI001D058CBB|nr:uncharacterized protein KVR01_002506 [Diaporthe batatas]KAG8166817.1 hypothetical protein KVR01_002506 [Diaporthe batatas]